MTVEELKDLFRSNGITFVPHHSCALCGEYTGWYLFGRWPPYEVAYSPDCGCGPGGHAFQESWENVLDWVCDEHGELREWYRQYFNITGNEKDNV